MEKKAKGNQPPIYIKIKIQSFRPLVKKKPLDILFLIIVKYNVGSKKDTSLKTKYLHYFLKIIPLFKYNVMI